MLVFTICALIGYLFNKLMDAHGSKYKLFINSILIGAIALSGCAPRTLKHDQLPFNVADCKTKSHCVLYMY